MLGRLRSKCLSQNVRQMLINRILLNQEGERYKIHCPNLSPWSGCPRTFLLFLCPLTLLSWQDMGRPPPLPSPMATLHSSCHSFGVQFDLHVVDKSCPLTSLCKSPCTSLMGFTQGIPATGSVTTPPFAILVPTKQGSCVEWV